jgi:hypothetical protein
VRQLIERFDGTAVCRGMRGAMPKVTLDVPEDVARLLKAMEKKLKAEARAARAFGEVDPDGALKAIDEAANALTVNVKRRLLQGYDVDAARVRLGGRTASPSGATTSAPTISSSRSWPGS